MNKIKKIKECEYKECIFQVELEYYYDEVMEEYYVDETLGNENLKRIRNEYIRIKNLLLDDDIKKIRNKYLLSQRDYSIALGFGEITITRYESKTVQDKAQDSIIRLSSNPNEFLMMLKKNKEKYIDVNGVDKYNELQKRIEKMALDIELLMNKYDEKDRGNEQFKMAKLKSVISNVVSCNKKITKTLLAKLLWYIDCLSYKVNNKSMTGLVYISMPYGAYPKMYDQILSDRDFYIKDSWIRDHECFYIEDVKANDLLNDKEKRIIEYIMSVFKDFNSKEIVEYMHNEDAYKETNLFDIISYEYAHNIKIYKGFN